MLKSKAYELLKKALLLAATVSMLSCKKDSIDIPDPEVQLHPVSLVVPANFPQPIPDAYNPLTAEGIALGRKLFYDKRLSASNQLSCASCHHQELAFSDGLALSNIGESRKTLHRHAPALINLAWMQNGLFWDGGSTNLESQAFAPLASEDEMHQNLYELEAELNAVPEYVKQFKLVFGREIRSADIVKAIAQFERTFISGNSKYDRYVRKETGSALTTTELQGLALVSKHCKSCHGGELFTDDNYHNNGVDSDFSDTSLEGLFQGRYRLTHNPADMGKYKTPTLRNVMLSAPYMHDGRFATIDAVLQHYAEHVKESATTDALLYQNGGRPGIPLGLEEKKAIVSFLNALTDETFISDAKLSNPNQ